MSIYLGFDPEFQALNTNKNPVMAHKVGFEMKKAGDASFRDGANIEINATGTPPTCRENLESNFQKSLNSAIARLPAGYVMGSFAAYEVSKRDVLTAPDDVREFGCKPSKDAYTGEIKTCPLDGANHFYRYAGGHMHFSTSYGYSPEALGGISKMAPNIRQAWQALSDPAGQRLFVKICDLLIGIPLTCIYDDPGQFQRRRWYGQAGEYRSQQYGMHHLREFSYPDPRGAEVPTYTWDPLTGSAKKITMWAKWIPVCSDGDLCDACQNQVKDYGMKLTKVISVPTYVGVEYRVPPPQLFNHQAINSLFFGVGRHIIHNFDYYSKKWDESMADIVREAINTGRGATRLLQTVPGWYSPDSIKAVKKREEIHRFNTVRTAGTQGWDFYRRLWGINLPPAGGLLP